MMDDDLEIHEAIPEEQGFLLSTLAVRASEYGARVRDLEAENGRLALFARQIIECAYNGQDADGGTIQSLALTYGLLRKESYDPARHGASMEAEPGDEWYVMADTVARAIAE